MDGGEIKAGVAIDGGLHLHFGAPLELRTEERDGLRVGAAKGLGFHGTEMLAEVLDELGKGFGAHLGLSRVNLVPHIPGKEGPGAAPALGGKGKAGLDELTGVFA